MKVVEQIHDGQKEWNNLEAFANDISTDLEYEGVLRDYFDSEKDYNNFRYNFFELEEDEQVRLLSYFKNDFTFEIIKEESV